MLKFLLGIMVGFFAGLWFADWLESEAEDVIEEPEQLIKVDESAWPRRRPETVHNSSQPADRQCRSALLCRSAPWLLMLIGA